MTSGELVRLTDPADIERLPVEQRGVLITRALEESKSWLAVATKGTDPTPIAEFKAWAATVAEMTRQKGLAEDIQLDALEMVRRAERGIGLAIRNGQGAGEIATTAEANRWAGRLSAARRAGQRNDENFSLPPRPTMVGDYVTSDDMTGNGAGIAHLTDDVTDEVFEEALEEGRREGNLSRANVVRKVKAPEDRVKVIDPGGDEEYTAKPSGPSKRSPLPSRFSKVTADLSRIISRYERLTTDDRYRANRIPISEACMPQVRRAVEVLSTIMNDLSR